MYKRLRLLAVLSGLLAIFFAGCGGAGSGAVSPESGTVGVKVIFPSQSEVQPTDLPQATRSVRIKLTPGVEPGTPGPAPGEAWKIERLLVSPPAGGPVSTLIYGVAAGWVNVLAQGFASTDGTGEVIAEASETINVLARQQTDVNLITEALCTSVVVNPTAVTLVPEETTSLEAKAYDADGNLLLGAAFDWSSSNQAVAVVEAGGKVTPAGIGLTTAQARERRTGKQAACAVTVAEWIDVATLSIPSTSDVGIMTPALAAGERYRFVASGVWYPWGSTRRADAAWYESGDGLRWTEDKSLQIDDLEPAWIGTADGVTWAPHTLSATTHTYRYYYVGMGVPVRVWQYDIKYVENTGSLSVVVQRHP